MKFDKNEIEQRAAKFLDDKRIDPDLLAEVKPFQNILPKLVNDPEIRQLWKTHKDHLNKEDAFEKQMVKKYHLTGYDALMPIKSEKVSKEDKETMNIQFLTSEISLRNYRDFIEKKMTTYGATGFDDLNVLNVQSYIDAKFNDSYGFQKRGTHDKPVNISGHHHESFVPSGVGVPTSSAKHR